MKKRFIHILLISSLFIISSCGDDPVDHTADYSIELQNVGNDVILKTYEDLQIAATNLSGVLGILNTFQTTENLEIARSAWKAARVPWEQSEGFLFGPVDQQGIDPSIDSWPVNETDLDAVLNSGETLTKTYIDGLDGTLKGFHTLEYLLFGVNGHKDIQEFTSRQFEYLNALGLSLAGATYQLYNSWYPGGENYLKNIVDAGKSGSIYPSQKSALQEIVNGMIVIADEVANGKINDPFSQQDVKLEESRFSANSKKDFADNIISIRNLYTGNYNLAGGPGISGVIKTKDNELDFRVQTEIQEAIDAINAIEGTFTWAIFNSPQTVTNAQNAVRELQQTLESEVLPIITNL